MGSLLERGMYFRLSSGSVGSDYSSGALQYGGFRIERNDVGPGKLSAYYSRYDANAAHYLDGNGNERRDNLDLRYAIARGAVDWDLEGMRQTGRLGNEEIRAWAVGSRGGYAFKGTPWSPRIGIQVDLASIVGTLQFLVRPTAR